MPAEFLNNLQSKYYGSSSYFNKDVTIYSDLTGLANALIVGQTTIHGDLLVITNPNPLTGKPIPPNIVTDGNITAAKTVTAPTFVGEKFTGGNFTGTFNGTINVQSWKGFDIKHPNKPNHRLRHICLEGPEAGVYHRGRLTNSNIIDIPEYWINLIDPESITVSLTQIGYSQDLIVDKIEWGRRIFIKSGTGANIDCYYVIHASRVDGEKLIVEYEGETPSDYPGDPTQYSISGYDYGRKE